MADLRTTEALALAWSFGWRIAAGIILGYYADQWLGTSPLLTLVFGLSALAMGVRAMLAVLRERASSGDAAKTRTPS